MSMERLSQEEKLSHLRVLVAMASVDGEIGNDEKNLLEYLVDEWGLSKDDVDAVMSRHDQIRMVLPEGADARFQQLYDVTEMMIIDGAMKVAEKDMCGKLAEQLGYQSAAVTGIIEEILAGNRVYNSTEKIVADAKVRVSGLLLG